MKPIIYLYFHSKILKWKGKEMTEKEFLKSFFQWRIPKTLRYVMMQEMEQIGLLKVEKKMVYINNYYFNEDEFKQGVKFSDDDTKAKTRTKNPYIPMKEL